MPNPDRLPLPADAGSVFQAGDRVGPYRLIEPLGRGGMGEVWRAERDDGQLQRQVALKLPVLAARRSVLAQRFARERDILAALAHPHIARLYDAGITDDDQPYLALELVDGRPITHHCQQQALPVRERVQLMLQVMQAVQHAHANLVIHRDLKPGNVLVTPQGQAMLLDFGIAKLLLGESTVAPETELTLVGGRAMTPEYAAPEQIDGAPISIATDIWALGVLLYELVAGRRPFTGDHRFALEQAVLRTEPARPGPSTLPRAAAADLDTIVLKALKKRPFERYATVEAFADDLRRWLKGEAVLAQPDSRGYRLRRFVARHRAAVATASALAAFVLLAGGFSLHQARLAEEQSRVARVEAETAKAVQEFLEGIFKANSGDQADPIRARQRTAKDLLDEGAARIEKGLLNAPEARTRVLKTLGDMYEDMVLLDTARELHARRAALAASHHGEHSSQRLLALADLANVLVSADRMEEARVVLDQAEVAFAQARHDDAALVAYHLARGWYFRHVDPPRGLADSRVAVELLDRRPPTQKTVYALTQYGSLLKDSGQPQPAMEALQRAIDLARQPASQSNSTLSGLQLELADLLGSQGLDDDAQRLYAAAVASASTLHPPDQPHLAIARVWYGQYLFTQEKLAGSVEQFAGALDAMAAVPVTPDLEGVRYMVFSEAANANLAFGRLADAGELLERAGRLAAGQPDREVTWHARRARWAIQRGDSQAARPEVAKAMQALDRLPARLPAVARLVGLARLELALADGDAAQSQRQLQALLADGSLPAAAPETQRWRCAVDLLGQDWAAATQSCRAAGPSPARPLTASRLLIGQAEAALQLGQPQSALAALQQADRLAAQATDMQRSPLALQLRLAFAQAHAAMGDTAAARQQLQLAGEIVALQPRALPGRPLTLLARLSAALPRSAVHAKP